MKAIAAKLVKIMDECSYVQKKGRNSFHNYKYALASDVLDKVGESCVKHGVATVSNAEILEWRPIDKQGKDGTKTEFYATVKVCITAIDQESGEAVTFSGVGCGQDVGDKAVMKAETAAIKYAWMTTLNIATGDDPEADESVDKRNSENAAPKKTTLQPQKPAQPAPTAKPKVTDTQRKKIFAMANEAGIKPDEMRELIHRDYNVASSNDLTQEQAEKVIKWLGERIKDNQQEGSN